MARNKPKVSSNSIKKEKIENVLRGDPEGLFPKQIAFKTDINVSTVKSILKVMGNVKRHPKIRGLYQLDEKSTHSIFDWNFHNLYLTCEIPSYNGERIKESLSFDFLNLEFEIGADSKKASLHISSEPPINISSIILCFDRFCMLVEKYANIIIS